MGALAIMTFLKNNWKWIAIGIAFLSLIGYIKTIQIERDHYHQRYISAEAQIAKLVDSQKIAEQTLRDESAQVTAKYKDTLKTANTLVTENARLNSENIKNAKELANVKLSLDAIRLFNASKQSTAEEANSSKAVSGNDDSTAAVAKALEEKSQSLADLLQVVNTNDANHLKCIKQVEEWQKFWPDVEATVEKYNAVPR